MQKILITLPNSIAGTLILKGLANGFRSNGCFVCVKDLRELSIDDIQRFKPDAILGYDYGFLFSDDEKLKDYILNNQSQYKLVHYFADEPNGKFAYVNKPHLFDEFKKVDAISFVWDRDFVQDLNNAFYLPLAVDSKAYQPKPSKRYEITFVGRPLTEKRQKILAALVKTFGRKLAIFSYERHFLQSLDDMRDKQFLTPDELDIYKSAYKGFLKTEREISDVYFNSAINLNITLQGKSGLNYRVFEVLASCGFLITDDLEDIHKNFEISKELEVYTSVEDLVDKIEFYLKNPQIAQKIALLGYGNVLKSHSYTARARKILETIGFRNKK